jgi:hypothetical protein
MLPSRIGGVAHEHQRGRARLRVRRPSRTSLGPVLSFLTCKSGFPTSPHKQFRQWGTTEVPVVPAPPSTNIRSIAKNTRPWNEDRKARRRAARKAKRMLAGCNHRQLAGPSQIGPGTIPDTVRREKRKKRRRKIEATVC